ncbi:MAG: hypothetical protein KF801_02240 [Cryobacterium sp.]|nr:hypothetical protein [Cryobacterium sp.]
MSPVRHFLSAHLGVPSSSLVSRLLGRNPIPRALRPAFRLACGEVSVADALTQLGSGWMAFHAVPLGNGLGVLEYIVIGPPGVYSVAVRQHPGKAVWIDAGTLVVDGERMPHIRDAEFEAVRASQLLSEVIGSRVEVTPCLILVEPRSLTVARPPRRVAVLTPRELRAWLKDMPRKLPQDALEEFRAAAAAQVMWQDLCSPTIAAAERFAAFRRIQTSVSQARHVRLTWVTGALVLLWLIAMVGIGGFTTSLLIR